MNTMGFHPAPSARPESAAEKQQRIAREAAGVAEARAQLDAGQFVAAEDVDAWIDSIGTAHERPTPPTRQR